MDGRIYLNDDWEFCENFTEDMLAPDCRKEGFQKVRIPHTVKETPFHYFDESIYQMVSGYIRTLEIPPSLKGKKLLLTFEGVAHSCKVYLNGKLVAEHACGYTAFTVDISDDVNYGAANTLVVRVDSRESQNIPPFGFVIDYMTYGGIYREVYLDVRNKIYLEDVYITTKQAGLYDISGGRRCCETSMVCSRITLNDNCGKISVRQYMREKYADNRVGEFRLLGEKGKFRVTDSKNQRITLDFRSGDVILWDVDNPKLYEIKTELLIEDEVVDYSLQVIGFRKALFRPDGFYLNGRIIKLVGLNRHQSYPYVGYAMPESMQKLDADILKNELGLNAVRTSHYPQSQHFINRCDELGLLVFTEIPGWQHIGDEEWKNQAVENTREMVLQYRNHPSIVLWGVRINESVDDDAFYERTNEVARKLDPSRQTGGVRCYKKSHLLEDVYTYNDFVHTGDNRGCDKKLEVTSDNEKPYLISEYMGHMYPTKSFDKEEARLEHAIRHANVLNDVRKQDDIAGSFGWCMFDYNTHKDFGSGDRICYHGVMDMFRNPKLAASVYACLQENTPVLEISSSMDIGEHPGCNRKDTYIFTNADSVKMYKNDYLIKEFKHESERHFYLKDVAPIRIDDYVGNQLIEQEKMSHSQAEAVKQILNEAAMYGMDNLSKKSYLMAAKLMTLYQMTMEDAVSLYNKYIGDWGGEATKYRFEAIKDGKVVKVVTKAPMTRIKLRILCDHLELVERHTYDVALVRIAVVDEYDNVLNYYNDPVMLEASGGIEIIGPKVIALSGGMGGTYVKTTGDARVGSLTVTLPDQESRQIEFLVRREE